MTYQELRAALEELGPTRDDPIIVDGCDLEGFSVVMEIVGVRTRGSSCEIIANEMPQPGLRQRSRDRRAA